MFILYGRKGSGSAAIEAFLALAGAPHEVMDVEKLPNGTAPAWYLEINPRGEVPSLKIQDDGIMTESAAIMLYLADLFPSAVFVPATTSLLRSQYLRWMVYMAAATYNSDLRYFYPDRYSTDPSHAPSIKQKAAQDMKADFDVFADGMGKGPFILGDTLSAVDIYAAMIVSWSEDQQALFKRQPKLQQLYAGVSAQPQIRAVWDRHGMP